MYIDRNIDEFPFDGTFYRLETVDASKPLDEREEREVAIYATECDIQESQKTDSGGIKASFEIYFPFDKAEGIRITRGDYFRGEMYGMAVNGVVIGLFPTQMDKCTAYIRDFDV